MESFVIDGPDRIGPVLDEALAGQRPVRVEVMSDPDVPALPRNITAKQARNYLMAILKGDPDASRIVKASLKETVRLSRERPPAS
jgi:pyruvate dehydrogenase (quinone)